MPSEAEEILREVAHDVLRDWCGHEPYMRSDTDRMTEILSKKLLRLLEAGQAMRDWKFDDYNSWAKMQQLYDVAKAAIRSGK